jgi:hypothetical protein
MNVPFVVSGFLSSCRLSVSQWIGSMQLGIDGRDQVRVTSCHLALDQADREQC